MSDKFIKITIRGIWIFMVIIAAWLGILTGILLRGFEEIKSETIPVKVTKVENTAPTEPSEPEDIEYIETEATEVTEPTTETTETTEGTEPTTETIETTEPVKEIVEESTTKPSEPKTEKKEEAKRKKEEKARQAQLAKEEKQKILEEVAAVFDKAPYIHIGADEKSITYGNFLKIMTDKIHSLGKLAVCWNPISGVTITSATGFDMTQMWSTAGTKVAGIPNIDYTNHFDVFADLVGIYKSNIYYEQKGNPEVAGTISAPWNDRKTATEEDIFAQNNIYANTIASAERAWIGGGKQYIEKGGTMLPNGGDE